MGLVSLNGSGFSDRSGDERVEKSYPERKEMEHTMKNRLIV
jgi:hypothetical protein